MRIAYVSTGYQTKHTGGGNAHIGQFIANALALGQEIWVYPGVNYPGVHTIPTRHFNHIKTMRHMDALYIRLEKKLPKICDWSLPPRRLLYGFPVVVWEFNTIPDEAMYESDLGEAGARTGHLPSHYGRGCNLAVCVSQPLADIARRKFGIDRTLVIPNASDPDLFHPGVPIARRLMPFQHSCNVVWIGSGKEKWHDLEMLGEAAKIVWEIEPGNINFHIIGPDLAGIMADMLPNVYYWGAEYYEKLPNWLAGMNVGLNLYRPGSADYNSPLKVFDYMASGLAVVSTSHPVVSGLFSHLGQSDLFVPPGDSKRLADILLNLASDRERIRRLGQAGRQLIINQYNWRRAVQDTMTELESVLRERRRKECKQGI